MKELLIYAIMAAVVLGPVPSFATMNPRIHHQKVARFPNNCQHCVTCHCPKYLPAVLRMPANEF